MVLFITTQHTSNIKTRKQEKKITPQKCFCFQLVFFSPHFSSTNVRIASFSNHFFASNCVHTNHQSIYVVCAVSFSFTVNMFLSFNFIQSTIQPTSMSSRSDYTTNSSLCFSSALKALNKEEIKQKAKTRKTRNKKKYVFFILHSHISTPLFLTQQIKHLHRHLTALLRTHTQRS